uniref:Serine protease n=1 Tax=Ostrinia latipennis TaxID=99578 RepID=A0A0F7R7Y2_9NEOP|nr:serine protease [Ostrinia latipennis]
MIYNSILAFVLNLMSVVAVFSQFIIEPVYVNESALVPRVVNGYVAALGDVPYQVSFKAIATRVSYYHTFCGGVIIGRTKLVTAAHCFEARNSEASGESISKEVMNKLAVAGTLLNGEIYQAEDKPTGAQWRKISTVSYPSSYRFPSNDIAIVITLLPFHFNEHIAPISYARSFEDYRGECLVSGYGRRSKKQKLTSGKLLLATLEVLPLYWCTKMHRKNMSSFICTSDKIQMCTGDSGGPLVCSGTKEHEEGSKGILVGIVSGHSRAGSFFTRVSSYAQYIGPNEVNSGQILKCYCYQIILVHYAFSILYFVFLFHS